MRKPAVGSGEDASSFVQRRGPTIKALVSGMSLDDSANRAVLSDRMEELGRTAEAKLLRSQHPVRYNFNAPCVGPVLTAGEYIEGEDEDAESGLQVLWGEPLLGTIEATQRKGVPLQATTGTRNRGKPTVRGFCGRYIWIWTSKSP